MTTSERVEVDIDPVKVRTNQAICERLVLAGIPVEIGHGGRLWPKYGTLRQRANGAFVRFEWSEEE